MKKAPTSRRIRLRARFWRTAHRLAFAWRFCYVVDRLVGFTLVVLIIYSMLFSYQ